MGYEPLHHKYRPQNFSQLVGQDAIAQTLSHALEQQRIAPAYLFCGPRGTGKTSSARILAKSLNCLSHTVPNPQPCGQCEVCRGISNGSILDIVEIDAASNTGVDNIRELIERAQFAPVQCRYKVYVVDECLTGDTLVQTRSGFVRIDDPQIEGQQVLSYNEQTGSWEYKKAIRWFDQGTRDILEIQTTHRKISCTENHLIRTNLGWVAARDVKEGMTILSPVPAVAAPSSTNTVPMDECAALPEATSLRAISMGKSPIASTMSLHKLNRCAPSANADAERNWRFPNFYSKKEEVSAASRLTGSDTPSRKDTGIGNSEPRTIWQKQASCQPKPSDLSTAPFWETGRSLIPISTVAFPGWLGLTVPNKPPGWSTKPLGSKFSVPSSNSLEIKATANSPLAAAQPVTLTYKPSSTSSDPKTLKNLSPSNGSPKFLKKAGPGGTWMTAPSVSAPKVALKFNSTPKDILKRKTNSSLGGSLTWATHPLPDPMSAKSPVSATTMSRWEPMPLESGSQTCNNTPFPQWHTNLETVVSVRPAGREPVYDIEVEDNHNFVANGLLVHNCHMLSTAAFNALLKTLEEPPEHVIFVLATTDPQRVLPTIISRCQRFDFRRIPLEAMVGHLQAIAQQESIDITEDAVRLVAQVAQGGLRDAESLLDQLSLLEPPITAEKVWDLVGAVPERDLLELVKAIAADDSVTTLDTVRRLMDRGREPMIVLQNLAGFYRDLIIAKTAGGRADLVPVTPPTWEAMKEFSQSVTLPLLLTGQRTLREAETQLRNTTQPRLWLEVTLMNLLPSAQVGMGGVGAIAAAPVQPSMPAPPPAAPPRPISPPPQPPSQPPTAQSASPPPQPTAAARPSTSTPSSPPLAKANPAVEPPPPPSTTPTPAADLAGLWAQIIAQVKPLGTRALLQQQGHLISYSGKSARVGIKSEKLLKMAQSKLPNIEAAFEKLLGQSVKVSLEVADAPPGSQAPVSAMPPTPVKGDRPVPPPSSPEMPTSAPPPENSAPPVVAEAAPADPPPAEVSPTVAHPATWQPESDLDRAVKSFAEFFNGQIVDMDDDAEEEGKNGKAKKQGGKSKPSSSPGSDVPF